MEELISKRGFICDMDGVLYRGNKLLPGVPEFIDWLEDNNKKYLFLTNESRLTPEDLSEKMHRLGVEVDPSHFYTSALETARFLSRQAPGCKAFVIGEHGMIQALEDAGITIDDKEPDYVIISMCKDYNVKMITKAINLVNAGARLIGTNCDLVNPEENGVAPDCRALIAPVEMVTKKYVYYTGKPNPLMIRSAIKRLGLHTEDIAIIGDRMDTDIIAGIQSGLDPVLVLSGVTDMEECSKYPYKPRLILNGVGDIPKCSEKIW
ncbi:MAG: HAD-IIA family hydrolase [Anaerovoracaceae bacterium]